MSEAAERFARFSEAVFGYRPYDWQLRVVDYLVEHGSWPQDLSSPTGSGKGDAVAIHVFMNAFAGEMGISELVPRRLFLVVNRRALVDSQFDKAAQLQKAIVDALENTSPDCPDIVKEVAEGLRRRAGGRKDVPPLVVGSLRGGVGEGSLDRSWRMYLEAVMIVCATPDMFGSRLLFRGYGVSWRARAQEAGLIAYDSVVIVDEAHLNEQLLFTAQQVGRIESFAAECIDSRRCLQVVRSTATPLTKPDPSTALGVTEDDLEADEGLRKRMLAQKSLSYERVDLAKEGLADYFAEKCQSLAGSEGSVGAIVNSVPLALAIASRLRGASEEEDGVACIVGRMRFYDRGKAVRALPVSGKGGAKFIVGTQALEVGMDYDLGALVTEMAPASSLAQRFGRVNRFGDHSQSTIVVVDTGQPSGPYEQSDLDEARDWISRLEGDGSSWSVFRSEPPARSRRRPVFQRLERFDVSYLSRTSERLWAEDPAANAAGEVADLDLWLRDELGSDSDHDIFVAVRSALPRDTACAEALLSRVPPDRRELYPCSIGTYFGALRDANETRGKAGKPPLRSFVDSNGEGFHYTGSDEGYRLPPGSTVVLDAEDASLFVEGTVARRSAAVLGAVSQCAEDVYPHAINDDGLGGLPFEVGASLSVVLGDDFEGIIEEKDRFEEEALSLLEGDEDEDGFDAVSRMWDQVLDRCENEAFAEVARNPEFLIERDEDGYASGIHVVCNPNLDTEYYAAAEVSSMGSVPLERHSVDVAREARFISDTIGMPDYISHALEVAGVYHDAGKADSRFQRLLHGDDAQCGDLLAKSPNASRASTRAEYRKLGLVGWRHEQLSAAIAWSRLEGNGERNLISLLIGRSHGHGRDAFARGADDLTVDDAFKKELAASIDGLYREGTWEWIADSISRRLGYWGTAYLEALLRAADSRVSAGECNES